MCQVLVALEEVDRAETISGELLERAGGDLRTEHFGYHFLADCALIRGDTVEAEKRYRQSLRAALPLGDVIETTFEVQGVAMAAAGNGDAEKGLRLAARVEATLGVARHLDLDPVLGRAARALPGPGARASSERKPTRCGRKAGSWTSTTPSSSRCRATKARAAA